jgi:hypothetical protein
MNLKFLGRTAHNNVMLYNGTSKMRFIAIVKATPRKMCQECYSKDLL